MVRQSYGVAADAAVQVEDTLRSESLVFQVSEKGVYFPRSLRKTLLEMAHKQLWIFLEKLFRPVCHKISPELIKELISLPL